MGLGMVCFYANGLTLDENVHGDGVISGKTLNDGMGFHRLRFNTGGPDETVYGSVPGVRLANDTETADADLITGHTDETEVFNESIVVLPPGAYRLLLRTKFSEYNSSNDAVWAYKVLGNNATDMPFVYSKIGRRMNIRGGLSLYDGPLGGFTDTELSTSVDFELYTKDTNDVLLTFINGWARNASEFDHWYALWVEKLA